MPRYAIVYLGGNPPATPEEGKKNFARYMEWLNGLGEAAISPANPFKNTHTVAANGLAKSGSDTKMSGYTLVEADTMEHVLEMAKSCPFLETGGTLEVSEIAEMPVKK